MNIAEQRAFVRKLKLEGLTGNQIAERLGPHTERGTATRIWVHKLLEPTTEDPTTVRNCPQCRKPFLSRSDQKGQEWCSPECVAKRDKGTRTVSLAIDEEVWRTLGFDPDTVTAGEVREVLKRLAAGVKRKKGNKAE